MDPVNVHFNADRLVQEDVTKWTLNRICIAIHVLNSGVLRFDLCSRIQVFCCLFYLLVVHDRVFVMTCAGHVALWIQCWCSHIVWMLTNLIQNQLSRSWLTDKSEQKRTWTSFLVHAIWLMDERDWQHEKCDMWVEAAFAEAINLDSIPPYRPHQIFKRKCLMAIEESGNWKSNIHPSSHPTSHSSSLPCTWTHAKANDVDEAYSRFTSGRRLNHPIFDVSVPWSSEVYLAKNRNRLLPLGHANPQSKLLSQNTISPPMTSHVRYKLEYSLMRMESPVIGMFLSSKICASEGGTKNSR